ncbi:MULTISPECIES: FKBP-type peptidyl-prolyl cis-trans isomerase [unclassified Wolbachia]|uniref:FKBP-type peptidyl-prolyl cis-trans isomerase n=1 Tax=unclassified Wolbachia TaxID=2640676 RepID=UPI00221F0E2B|nr:MULTISPECIES: FKBP-type peptidyl-prolyl cis-trans isomerase [unclassified Wolbachia]WGJ62346.1 FKBP-type peptidyl-prolyl cis-trans isomerase [Wolbachia endosymbiont of Frankliniella intonsa]
MVKKIILQIFIFLVMVLTLASVFIITIVYINKDKPEKEDKLYEINATHDGLTQTIARYLVKPILESALDRYIEKHGLAEYLEEITQQKEEETIKFYEITEGSGSKAFCGQEVLLQMYKISNNLAALPSQVSDITLRIGEKEVSLGVIGMKEGGERVVTIAADDNKMSFNSYYIKLIEVKDKYPDSVNNLMIFNDLINKTRKQVKCGDEISAQYSIKRYNGEYIVKDQTVQFKVGDRKMPLAIELGVVGMRAGNKRTVLSPPDLLTDVLTKGIDCDIAIIDLSLNSTIEK